MENLIFQILKFKIFESEFRCPPTKRNSLRNSIFTFLRPQSKYHFGHMGPLFRRSGLENLMESLIQYYLIP